MWTRVDLKEKAKAILHGTYWKAFGVSVLAAVFTLDVSSIINYSNLVRQLTGFDFFRTVWAWWLCAFLILFSIFIGNVILVGIKRFFICNRDGKAHIGNLFYGFAHNYRNIVGVQFITDLMITLWTLLLIIPGIIAGYQFCMVPYLLSENPGMNGVEARRLSAQMTDGQKLDLFVLDLSFFGWNLLGLLCFIVGGLFVTPYIQATKAELYITLRAQTKLTDFPELKQEGDEHVSMAP